MTKAELPICNGELIKPLEYDPVPSAIRALKDARRKYPNANILPQIISQTIKVFDAIGEKQGLMPTAQALIVNMAFKLAGSEDREKQFSLDQVSVKIP